MLKAVAFFRFGLSRIVHLTKRKYGREYAVISFSKPKDVIENRITDDFDTIIIHDKLIPFSVKNEMVRYAIKNRKNLVIADTEIQLIDEEDTVNPNDEDLTKIAIKDEFNYPNDKIVRDVIISVRDLNLYTQGQGGIVYENKNKCTQ